MKNIILIFLIALMFGCLSRQTIIVHPKVPVNYFRRMAVLPFYNYQYCSRDGVDLADGIQTKLVEHVPQLELVERQRIRDIITEWNLVRNGIVDITTAVKVGKLVGARLILTGQIKDITINRAREMMYGSMRVSVRIIDIQRGTLRWAKEIKIRHPGLWGRYNAYYNYTGRDEFKSDMIDIVCDIISKEFYSYEKEI